MGIAREQLLRHFRAGVLASEGRGLYRLANAPISESHDLALVAKLVPNAVVCLLSAFQFHGVTTQSPHQVWIMLPNKARRPAVESPPIRVVRASPRAFEAGVEFHEIEAVDVRVHSLVKTVADCFKYRSKIGLDVAIETLRDAVSSKRVSIDQIYAFAPEHISPGARKF